MKFIDRQLEMKRLDSMLSRRGGGLVLVYGRRRIGKTRLLLEWVHKHNGLYTVADQSSADVQRRYFAQVVAKHLAGFADVQYPDWISLLQRLGREAKHNRWRGPLVIDELPYLVSTSPELPSVLQRFVDHEAKEAGLVMALAGSSQRMMQGLVLSAHAPLYGRAREIIGLGPLESRFVKEALHAKEVHDWVEFYAAWGGVPRYWELALDETGTVWERFDKLVLDPMGPLHQEPDRLLIEELPPALEVRPVLDAIGMGVHRVSEIAGRIGYQATSLSRPLERIIGMGLVKRELPFGESEKQTHRGLYKISDPFIRLWFRVVAPNRGLLATASRADRIRLLKKHWPEHVSLVWEEICRSRVANLSVSKKWSNLGKWQNACRYWRGNEPEWDVVAEDPKNKRLLLGEAKWSDRPFEKKTLGLLVHELLNKNPPSLPKRYAHYTQERVLFVPQISANAVLSRDEPVITGKDLFR